MIEPVTITTISAALGVRWAGKKLLGPVCDEIGQDLAESYSHRRLRNLNRIGVNAQTKLGPAIEEDGLVPPRVAWRVFEEGSWCDEAITAEYFGGILAGSRSPDGRDDRGVAWAGLVSRLATADIYLHYLVYDAFRRLHAGTKIDLGNVNARMNLHIYLPESELLTAIAGPDRKLDMSGPLISLDRERLIAEPFGVGGEPELREFLGVPIPERGVVFTPSIAGIELFLWAHGYRQGFDAILDETLTFESVEGLGSIAGAERVDAMREKAASPATPVLP